MAMLLVFLLFSPGAAVRSTFDFKEASTQALSVESGGRVETAIEDKNSTDTLNPVYRCDSPIYAIQSGRGGQVNRPLWVTGLNDNVRVHDNRFSDFELYSNNDQKCKDARTAGYRSSWSIRWRKDGSRMQSNGNWVTEERFLGNPQRPIDSRANRQFNVAASSASHQEYCIHYCGLQPPARTNTGLSEADLWIQNTHVRSFHIETLTPRSRNALPAWRVKTQKASASPEDSNVITAFPRSVCPPGNAFKFLLPRIDKRTAREFGCTEPGSGCA